MAKRKHPDISYEAARRARKWMRRVWDKHIFDQADSWKDEEMREAAFNEWLLGVLRDWKDGHG